MPTIQTHCDPPVSTNWRTSSGDQDPSPGWQEVFASADAICPWTVRRYHDEQSANAFFDNVVREDIWKLHEKGVKYVPTVFPGFSVRTSAPEVYLELAILTQVEQLGNVTQSDNFNEIPREAGRFLWRQFYNAQRLNSPLVYAAMFDEYVIVITFAASCLRVASSY